MPDQRKYLESHPWIDFRLDATAFEPKFWMLLGEVKSKLTHIGRVPIKPDMAQKLHVLAITKGAHSTTAIEGNTMSEEEVQAQVEGRGDLPSSREYQAKAVDNILEAYNQINTEGISTPLTASRISEFNITVLNGLELESGIQPGVIPNKPVGVGNYRGAPREDCEFLLQRLCNWITEIETALRQSMGTIEAGVLSAISVHLYLAWIHPYGDGNGRTARLLEFYQLQRGNVPPISAHLLSNHYNRTRDRYYLRLKEASTAGRWRDFYSYALEGLVDGLVEQLDVIHKANLYIAWLDYVHEVLPDDDGRTNDRKRHLLIDLHKYTQTNDSDITMPLSKDDTKTLSGRVAIAYFDKTEKTVNRDVRELEEKGLLAIEDGVLRARIEIMQAFVPSHNHEA